MTDPVPLHELLANYEPAPAKHGALIRAAVRLADYVLDVTTRLVIDLEPGEIDDGSLLYGFICDATNVGGRKPPPPDVISQTIPLDEIPTRSESYNWLAKIARALAHSLGSEITRDEALKTVAELEPVFQVGGQSVGDVHFAFDLEASRTDWAQALFR